MPVTARCLPMALLWTLLVVPPHPLHAEEAPTSVTVTEDVWQGDVRKGDPCILLENPRLKLTILRKGAYLISVVDKRSGTEFVHCSDANASAEHGIYDRIDDAGNHAYRLKDPKHLANREYEMAKAAPNTLRFTCQTQVLSVTRTMTLDPARPRLRIDVTYASRSPEAHRMGIVLISQFNLNQAPVSYNQAVVMPRKDGVDRLVTNSKGFTGADAKSGWWLAADRDSKKSVVMAYPTDGSVDNAYLYRIPQWTHMILFGPEGLVKEGDTRSLWQEYHFLSGAKDAESLAGGDVAVTPQEFERLKKALQEELATPPVRAGEPRKVVLPEAAPGTAVEPSPAGTPQATVIVLRNAIYDHPTQINPQTWLSLDRLLQAVAEIRGTSASLLALAGASANGLENEFTLAKDAATLSGIDVACAPSPTDVLQAAGFEKVFGARNWVREIQGVHVVGFAPGETPWLEETLTKLQGKRIVVIGDSVPAELATRTTVTLALCRQNTTMPSYARVGQWPVLHVPPVQAGETSGIAVINIFPELIDVLVKPMGESFGPRLFLDKTGKSPALGVPPFIQGQPLVKVAHISDTQIQLPTTTQTPDGKPLDQENMKAAIEEINGLGVDLVVNTGDLVNVGSNEEQWKVYQELRKPLRVPIHEVLGNHDWNQTTPEGSVLTGNFLKYTEDPLIYDVESKGVFFVLFGTAVVRREDLLQRVEKAKNARVTVLAYHDPMTEVKGYNWWKPETYQAVQALKPSVAFAGHLHFNQWNRKEGIHEFVGPSLAWTKMGDPGWNGYFIHAFYEKAVVSSFKRLGCNDLFFTVVTPYRADRAGSGTPPR